MATIIILWVSWMMLVPYTFFVRFIPSILLFSPPPPPHTHSRSMKVKPFSLILQDLLSYQQKVLLSVNSFRMTPLAHSFVRDSRMHHTSLERSQRSTTLFSQRFCVVWRCPITTSSLPPLISTTTPRVTTSG